MKYLEIQTKSRPIFVRYILVKITIGFIKMGYIFTKKIFVVPGYFFIHKIKFLHDLKLKNCSSYESRYMLFICTWYAFLIKITVLKQNAVH